MTPEQRMDSLIESIVNCSTENSFSQFEFLLRHYGTQALRRTENDAYERAARLIDETGPVEDGSTIRALKTKAPRKSRAKRMNQGAARAADA